MRNVDNYIAIGWYWIKKKKKKENTVYDSAENGYIINNNFLFHIKFICRKLLRKLRIAYVTFLQWLESGNNWMLTRTRKSARRKNNNDTVQFCNVWRSEISAYRQANTNQRWLEKKSKVKTNAIAFKIQKKFRCRKCVKAENHQMVTSCYVITFEWIKFCCRFFFVLFVQWFILLIFRSHYLFVCSSHTTNNLPSVN